MKKHIPMRFLVGGIIQTFSHNVSKLICEVGGGGAEVVYKNE